MPWRNVGKVRARLSLLLVFTMLSMSLPHASMAMPMASQGATSSMHAMHDQGQQMADQDAVDPAVSHQGQSDQCHCGAHCGLCGACHSTPAAATVAAFIGLGVSPAGPPLSNLTELYLPPDPHPPRA